MVRAQSAGATAASTEMMESNSDTKPAVFIQTWLRVQRREGLATC